MENKHCAKSVQIRSIFWSVIYPIRTEYGEIFVSLHIQSECGKIRTRKYSLFGHFSRRENEGNENKIILRDFNCTMDKIERDVSNKILYKCHFNYALSKLIMDNGLEDLWRMENPDSSEFTRYNRSSGTRSTIDSVYTDIKMASNTKINHIMVPSTDHYNAIFIDRFPSKTKIGEDSWYFNSSPLCEPELSLTTDFSFFIKNIKHNNYLASDWLRNTKSSFKEDTRTFLKIQENIRISILDEL